VSSADRKRKEIDKGRGEKWCDELYTKWVEIKV